MKPSDGHPSTRIKFARIFLRSLSKMRNSRPSSSSSSSICVKKRSERLKMAAYWCMARAVGSRRAWSRAVLMKLMKRRMRSGKSRSTCLGNKINNRKKKKKKTTDDEDGEEGLMKRQTEKLRQLVPGGKSMDICSLLDETAHFVTCLAAQVHVMQTIAHHYS